MKIITLVLITIFQSSTFASSLEARICGNSYSKAELLKDWEVEKSTNYCSYTNCSYDELSRVNKILSDRVGEKYCATASCSNESKKLKITKCFLQSDSKTFNFMLKTQEINKEKLLEAHFVDKSFEMHENDVCFEACKTINNKIIPLSFFNQSGLNRESCQNCFKNRETYIPDTDDFISYPEIGKKFYKGQLCYELCKDPRGEILIDRKLSLQCKECIGLSQPQMKFTYILSKDKTCYEHREKGTLSAVAPEVCLAENFVLTKYEKDYTLTIAILFGVGKYPCTEVDSLTGGNLLKKFVEPSLCDEEKSINNTNRNSVNEKNNNHINIKRPPSSSGSER